MKNEKATNGLPFFNSSIFSLVENNSKLDTFYNQG